MTRTEKMQQDAELRLYPTAAETRLQPHRPRPHPEAAGRSSPSLPAQAVL